MEKIYYYAVKVGYEQKIYTSWDECKEALSGFPNPVYKKFSSLEEAKSFISGVDYYEQIVRKELSISEAVAFVDGSFNQSTSTYGSGIYLFHDGIDEKYFFSGNDEQFTYSRNIMGEIVSVIKTLEIATKLGIKSISIFYDYQGIEYWYTGFWSAKSKVSIYYQNELKKYQDIKVKFIKVSAHANNKYNEMADKLAKIGSGLL